MCVYIYIYTYTCIYLKHVVVFFDIIVTLLHVVRHVCTCTVLIDSLITVLHYTF